jgi:hypothetical protein
MSATMKLLGFFQSLMAIAYALPYMGRLLDLWACSTCFLVRLGAGITVASGLDASTHRPKKTLVLYEYEGCPFCKYECLPCVCVYVCVCVCGYVCACGRRACYACLPACVRGV